MYEILARFVNRVDGATVSRVAGKWRPAALGEAISPPGLFDTPDKTQATRLTAAGCLGACMDAGEVASGPAAGAASAVSHAGQGEPEIAAERLGAAVGADNAAGASSASQQDGGGASAGLAAEGEAGGVAGDPGGLGGNDGGRPGDGTEPKRRGRRSRSSGAEPPA